MLSIALIGPGGEPVSFRRTIYSHGLAQIAPARIDEATSTYHTTLRVGDRPHRVQIRDVDGALAIVGQKKIPARDLPAIERIVRRMFRLDYDLSPFYASIDGDERLAWARAGAGRLMASPTLFEDVIKTICTTNCAWSATVRMTSALVELGGGAFPTPDVIARTPDSWFADVARMGYRGPYVKAIAADIASGVLDLAARFGDDASDDDVESALLELPGVGPYAAAHIMQLIGRHRRLVLDSWTRPQFMRLANKKRATDTTIRRAFARYGPYAGLAFWLFLTKEWTND